MGKEGRENGGEEGRGDIEKDIESGEEREYRIDTEK